MKATLKLIAALACATCVAAPAEAQALAEVQLSNFRWALTDLDPNDGITPSLTFFPQPIGLHSSVRWNFIDTHTGYTRSDMAFGGGFPSTVASGPWFDDEPHYRADLAASIIGSTLANTVMRARAAGYDRAGEMFSNIMALSGGMNFTLSPNSAVSFFADASVHSATWADAAPGYRSIANSMARMWLSPSFGNWGSTVLEHTAQYGDDTGSGYDQVMRMDYANLGIYDAHLGVALETMATISTALAPIPEPETYALLLAGLGIVAGARQLQRSRRAKPAASA
jgi:hypothetical protein